MLAIQYTNLLLHECGAYKPSHEWLPVGMLNDFVMSSKIPYRMDVLKATLLMLLSTTNTILLYVYVTIIWIKDSTSRDGNIILGRPIFYEYMPPSLTMQLVCMA